MVLSTLLAFTIAAQGPAFPAQLPSAPPQVETYLASEVGCHISIYCLEIDAEGRVIVGHGTGLSAFDGVTWRGSADDLGLVSQLTLSASGVVYVGSSRGLGRLTFALDGTPGVEWLGQEVWKARSPSMVKFMAVTDEDTVYAGGDEYVFRWDGRAGAGSWVDVQLGQEKPLNCHLFRLRDASYVVLPRLGVHRLENDEAVLVPGTDPLRSMDIQAVLASGDESALVFSADKGIRTWSPEGIALWESELSTALEGHRVFNANRLPSGEITVSSSRGLLVTSDGGDVRFILNEETGLASDASYSQSRVDSGGGLWVATFGGVSRARLESTVGVFGKKEGLDGPVLDVVAFQGRHYVATHRGLVVSVPITEPGATTTFIPVEGVEGTAWDLLLHAGSLWAATGSGIYRIEGGVVERTGVTQGVTCLVPADDQHIYAAGTKYLVRLNTDEPAEPEPTYWTTALHSVRSPYMDGAGRLWLPGMTGQGEWQIFRVDFAQDSFHGEYLDLENGVPSQPLSLAQVGPDLLLGYPEGLSRYEASLDRFLQDHPMQSALTDHGGGALNLTEGPQGDLWFWNAEGELARATDSQDGWTLANPLRSFGIANALCFVPDPSGRLWVGTTEGKLALVDPVAKEATTLPAPRIQAFLDGPDGRRPAVASALDELVYGQADLRFQFGWTWLEAARNHRFRTRLEGLNDTWSTWTGETYRDFPGLHEGHYVLELEARTEGGLTSPVTRLAFRVLPPWYRTPLAYGAMAALIALTAGLLVNWRQRSVRRRVTTLTAELEERRIAQEALRLKEAQLQQEIGEHRRTADQREQLGLQLHEAQKLEAVGRLAAGVAHDFNNILTVIHGEAEIGHASASLDGASSSQSFATIQDASERGAQLTKQLLEFSGKQPLSPRVVDLGELIQNMRGLLERVVLEDVALQITIESDLHVVEIDPIQLERVVMNLVVNASEAMPLGGEIKISASNLDAGPENHVAGPCIRLWVEDNGTGMDAETAASVFEPFFSTKGPGRVSGLGLATVHGIVRQAGGHIGLRSEPGSGTRFEIQLPVATRPEVPVAPIPDVLRPAPKGTTALVCDNDVQVRRVTSRLLERAGYEVISADSSDEALRRAEGYNGRIDVLVTDVVMPGLNGRELAAELAHSRPALRVVYLSGYPSDVLAPRGILAPDIRFVAKPFSNQQLLDSIAAALGTPPPEASVPSNTE